MSKRTKKEELVAEAPQTVVSENLPETATIASSDDDMEEPMAKDYPTGDEAATAPQYAVYFKEEFKDALLSTIGTLGYDRALGSPEINVRVNQIFDALNSMMGQPLTESQANNFITMIAKAPYNVIADVMEVIKTDQNKFFEVREM